MNTPFDYADLPLYALLEYQAELQQRLDRDTHRMHGVIDEIARRHAQTVVKIATVSGRIPPTEPHVEQAE